MQYPSGWTCELVVLRVERYFLGTIPYDGALGVAEHLEACESCAQHVVLRYPGAERARWALVEGDYAEDDVLIHDSKTYRQQALATTGEIGRISLGRDELQP